MNRTIGTRVHGTASDPADRDGPGHSPRAGGASGRAPGTAPAEALDDAPGRQPDLRPEGAVDARPDGTASGPGAVVREFDAPVGRGTGLDAATASALLASALESADAEWGCVWRVTGDRLGPIVATGGASGPERTSRAARSVGSPGRSPTPLPPPPTLPSPRVAGATGARGTDAAPDRLFGLVIDRASPLFLNRCSHATLDGLPSGHPPLHRFALVPCRSERGTRGLLFVANALEPFVEGVLSRLQGIADAHVRAGGSSAGNARDPGPRAVVGAAAHAFPLPARRGASDPLPSSPDSPGALDALAALDPADEEDSSGPSGRHRPPRAAPGGAVLDARDDRPGIVRARSGGTRDADAFERLFAASHDAVMRTDERGLVTRVNPAAERVFGVVETAVLGTPAEHLFATGALRRLTSADPVGRASLERDGYLEMARGEAVDGRRSDDTPLRLEVTAYRTLGPAGSSTMLVIADISDRVESARELQTALAQQQALMRLAPIGIVQLGADWTCLYANDMWCRLSRLTLDESLGTGWIDALHRDDLADTLNALRETLSRFETFEREVRLHSPLGEIVWVHMNASALLTASERMTGTLIVFTDVTERRRTDERLRRIAHHDALTGLLNRTFFLDRLSQALDASGRRGEVALLMLDLDGFKAVNDTLGHDHGDELLRQVAARLLDTVRTEDTVARLGGDEFTVTLTHLEGREQAGGVAAKIISRLRQPFTIKEQEVFVSASIGIAWGNRANSDLDTLIKQADIALYRAKRTGRSRHVYFTPELDQARRDRSSLVTSLRRAVDRHDFELHYQPQLMIGEQRLLGFEALLRWPDSPSPDTRVQEIIDALEETGLIGEVGEWVIGEACRVRMRWHDAGLVEPGATMSVNVSVRQLGTPGFVDQVARILERERMPAARLILEITESALVESFETGVIGELEALGVGLSLDDFGTGYSSLAYLGQLPLTHLKIDRSFIVDLPRRPQAVTIVKSIIAFARSLGIEVVAEGVEDARVLPLLAGEGCGAYQGYQFSRPLSASGIESLLRELDPVRLGHLSNFIDLGDARPAIGAE